MAVYQGARPRSAFALPAILRPGILTRPVRPANAPTRVARRTHARRSASAGLSIRRPATGQVGLALGAIVIVFSGAFLWLSQSVRLSATNYDVVRLVSEGDRLEALRVDLRADLDRLDGGPAIRRAALENGLGQLGVPVVIPAR
jgi:hypothetical protein